jgi:acetyltransferase-like isoleucine patch superfamily enzyme
MFLSQKKLYKIGFKYIGQNVLISDKCSIYSPEKIEIGNNVRIDDFSLISPKSSLRIGNFVHIGCYTSIIGEGDILIDDFVSISGRVSIYSSSDDYTGMSMTNPTVPLKYKKITHGRIHIQKHTIIGSGSLILPNIKLGVGCSIYAHTVIKEDCVDFGVYSGNPSKMIGKRLQKFLIYEKDLITNYQ